LGHSAAYLGRQLTPSEFLDTTGFKGILVLYESAARRPLEKVDKLTVFGGFDGVLKDVVRIQVPAN
jgi:hypothetical protein